MIGEGALDALAQGAVGGWIPEVDFEKVDPRRYHFSYRLADNLEHRHRAPLLPVACISSMNCPALPWQGIAGLPGDGVLTHCDGELRGPVINSPTELLPLFLMLPACTFVLQCRWVNQAMWEKDVSIS